MIIWILLLLFIVVPLFVVFKHKNYLTLFFTFLPFLMYTIYDVQSECIATNNSSEACVWGYVRYIYASVFGSALYLMVTAIHYFKSKLWPEKTDIESSI